LLYQDDLYLNSPQFKVVLPEKFIDIKLGFHVFNFLTFFFLTPQTLPIFGLVIITSKK